MNLVRPPKLAEKIARLMEDRILSEGWAVGTSLGCEAALAADVGVSRWSFREAMRILEQDGLIVSRRGGGGGLFVAAPVAEFVRNGLSHYLEYMRPHPVEVSQIWIPIENQVVMDAVAHMDAATSESLFRLAAAAEAAVATGDVADGLVRLDHIRQTILGAATNPALILFTASLSRTAKNASWNSSLDDAAYDALFPQFIHVGAAIARAAAQGDMQQAVEQSRQFLACSIRLLESALPGQGKAGASAMERAWRVYPAVRPTKKPELVASRIRDEIVSAGWPLGWNMGTEGELMARYGVGRSVLREAIRALERLGVVRMGRGASSGLTVIAPDPAQVIATCRRHLRRVGMTCEHVVEARACLSGIDEQTLAPLFLAIIAQEAAKNG